MHKKGIIAVISGFSGAGKGTIVNRLVQDYGYAISISATTRQPREGEIDGKHYFFKSKENFENMIKENELIEYAKYCDNYYGTPKDYVFEQINNGIDVLLEIEMQGALQVKKDFPDVSLIFITPPSARELRKRLEGRGTETAEVIEKRLARAVEECVYMPEYDYIMVNDDLDICVKEIHQLLQSLHFSVKNQVDLIEEITADFNK
ncbi:MAG: guanylate kinase [Lachnospiraceae bacterium]|nr:guanylate kinase [Lachnospiraceae bacterium]